MNTLFQNEHRCKCGKLLLKGIVFNGTLEIKCKRCGEIYRIGQIETVDDAEHYLLIFNEKGKITNISTSACKILGYSYDELIGKHLSAINPTIPDKLIRRFFKKELTSRKSCFQLDTIHQSKDGKRVPVLALLKQYQPNSKEKYILLSVKIKRTGEENKTYGKKLPLFLDNACDFYFVIDNKWKVEYASQSVKKLFGFSPETIIGKDYLEFLSSKRRRQAKKTLEYFSSGEQPFRIDDVTWVDVNDNVTHNEQYFTPNFDNLGQFIGYQVLGWVRKVPKKGKSKIR